jgi:hypothetical protein
VRCLSRRVKVLPPPDFPLIKQRDHDEQKFAKCERVTGEDMRLTLKLWAALLAWPAPAVAGSMEQQLQKLDPEERAHQVCVIKGIDTIRRDGKLPKADRLKTSITGRAKYTGTRVATKGGAVRAKAHWYALSFKCDVTADQMKALTFTYQLGGEIPEDKWEDLGLWR